MRLNLERFLWEKTNDLSFALQTKLRIHRFYMAVFVLVVSMVLGAAKMAYIFPCVVAGILFVRPYLKQGIKTTDTVVNRWVEHQQDWFIQMIRWAQIIIFACMILVICVNPFVSEKSSYTSLDVVLTFWICFASFWVATYQFPIPPKEETYSNMAFN